MDPFHLPQEIIERIVWYTCQLCQNDDFLYDLRLISHQFNEAVIYNLFFRDDVHISKSRQLHRRSCLACSLHQTSFGRFNTSYARMRLQAQINQQTKSHCLELREWHTSLRIAISVLKKTLAGLHLYSAGNRVQADQRFASSSSHPVLADRTSLMLCDAVANFIDTTNDGRLRHWRKHDSKGHPAFHLAPASFWVMITVYHIGDLDLIMEYLKDESFMKLVTESNFGSLSICLGIAARQGHKHVLLEVMNNYLDDVPYNKPQILAQACIAGQVECAKLLKFAIPEKEREQVFLDSLAKLEGTELQPALNYQAFGLLVDQCKFVLSSDMGMVRLCQRKGWSEGAMKLLQEQNWNHWKTPTLPSPTDADYSFRRSKRERIKIEVLFRYWKRLPETKEELDDLCKMTAEMAIEMNRFDMAEALYEYINGDITSVGVRSVIEAGGVDDGIYLLEARDAKDPSIWHKSISQHRDIVTIGQATLKSAIRNLQADSVAFLLERQVQLPKKMAPIQVDWRYRRTRYRQYEAVQRLLEQYNMKPVEVVLTESV